MNGNVVDLADCWEQKVLALKAHLAHMFLGEMANEEQCERIYTTNTTSAGPAKLKMETHG